jgi:hypothetical protein
MDLEALGRRTPMVIAFGLSGWWACGSGPEEPPPPPPRPAQIVKASGDMQTGTVDQTLTDRIVARVNDQFGQPMSGVTVDFTVTIGGGTVGAASGTTDANGQVSTDWTLGTTTGQQRVTAAVSGTTVRVSFSATADADVPDDLAEVSGNNQVAPRNATIQAPLVVRVVDQFGNNVPGVTVEFQVTGGGGMLNPAMADTDADGESSTAWTLGDFVGQQTVEATVASLSGVAVQFQAQAVNFSVASISPDTLVEGQSATIAGDGFDETNLANNIVTIDGVAATVTAATPTELTVTVPPFDCLPTRVVGVAVGLGGFALPSIDHPVRPVEFVTLAVGEMQLIRDPAEFCLQFSASSVGGDAYIVGVGSVLETPTATMFTATTGTVGVFPSAPALTPPPIARRAAPSRSGRPFGDFAQFEERRAHLAAELGLRAKERELLRRLQPSRLEPRVAAAARAVPGVGDTVMFRVPDLDGNLCDFTEITAVVRVLGSSGIFVTDVNNPTSQELTDEDLQAASDTFDLFIYDVDTTYFGPPSDLDANQRVVIVLSIEVNKLADGNVAGFVTSADLFPRLQCPSSDTAEVFYSHVPDPANSAGTRERTKDGVLDQMPALIAHEFTHIIQFSRRIIELQANFIPDTWELEGAAVLAEEVVAHSILGNSVGRDLGASTAFGGQGNDWYNFLFARLARYYGWDPPDGKNPNAPELCTLFGNFDINDPGDTACEPFWFYGASWSFQRQILDRFGPSQPNGETDLSRGWLDANPELDGVDNVEQLVGVGFDTLFANWAAMHWVDGRIGGVDPDLEMTSWDLFDVYGAVTTQGVRLEPLERPFAAFSSSRSVRAGSTAYTRLSAASARPAFAVRVRGAVGALLDAGMRPQLWIVREQ